MQNIYKPSLTQTKTTASLSLWSIQNIQWVLNLHSAGVGKGDWCFVNPPVRPAYLWMQERMGQKGVSCDGSPPVWAWYTFEKRRVLKNVSQLVSQAELENGLVLIKFSAPLDKVVLSDYSAWCDIYFTLLEDPHKSFTKCDERRVFLRRSVPGSNMQATLARIEKNWVVDVIELPVNSYFSLRKVLILPHESLQQFYNRLTCSQLINTPRC